MWGQEVEEVAEVETCDMLIARLRKMLSKSFEVGVLAESSGPCKLLNIPAAPRLARAACR